MHLVMFSGLVVQSQQHYIDILTITHVLTSTSCCPLRSKLLRWTRCFTKGKRPPCATIKLCCWWRVCLCCSLNRTTSSVLANVSTSVSSSRVFMVWCGMVLQLKIISYNDIYKTICYFVIFNPFLMSVCAGKECIERRLTALQSGLCVWESFAASWSGYDVSHFHPCTLPTNHICTYISWSSLRNALRFHKKNHKASGFELSKWLAVHLKFLDSSSDFPQRWTWTDVGHGALVLWKNVCALIHVKGLCPWQ